MRNTPSIYEYSEISRALDSMYKNDQDARLGHLEKNQVWDANIDLDHTNQLKQIVNEIGWPSIAKVWKESSSHAWLLCQHADHDLEFQKKCLHLMQLESKENIDQTNIAYLEDRIAVSEGRKQRYWTQFFKDANSWMMPYPIDDFENIEKRRRDIWLGTFEEYRKRMSQFA